MIQWYYLAHNEHFPLFLSSGAQKDFRDFSGRRADFYGSQKNVETLRSRIYQTEKDKVKEDRAKDISSKRPNRWQMWSSKDTGSGDVTDEKAPLPKERTLSRYLSRTTSEIDGKSRSSRSIFDRFRSSRDNVSPGEKRGSIASSWRMFGAQRSISLSDAAQRDESNNTTNSGKMSKAQRKQQSQNHLQEQHDTAKRNGWRRTDQCSLSSLDETNTSKRDDDSEVRSYSSEIGGLVSDTSPQPFSASRSNISIWLTPAASISLCAL